MRAALQLQIWRDILDFIGDAADGCWSTTVGAVVVRDSAGSMGFCDRRAYIAWSGVGLGGHDASFGCSAGLVSPWTA